MGWIERCVSIIAGVSVVAAVSVLVARSEVPQLTGSVSVSLAETETPATANPTNAPAPKPKPAAKAVPLPATSWKVGAVTMTADSELRVGASPTAPSKGPMPEGVLAAVIGHKRGFYHVLTPNDNTGWVYAGKVKPHLKGSVRPATSLRDATIVIDPGHGGHQPGARGKLHGTPEKDVNLAISKKLIERLTGARVFITNTGQHAALRYRAVLANTLRADAFVSVHNNALPDKLSKQPGSEVYYSQKPGSKRLAGLIFEELFKALRRYKIEFGRDPFTGAKYRLSQERPGEDYYGVLRRSTQPAVIVESMFITNPAEEKLLVQPQVQQVIADAIARGVKRFVMTKDAGSGFVDPYAKPTPQCPIPGCFEHRK